MEKSLYIENKCFNTSEWSAGGRSKFTVPSLCRLLSANLLFHDLYTRTKSVLLTFGSIFRLLYFCTCQILKQDHALKAKHVSW